MKRLLSLLLVLLVSVSLCACITIEINTGRPSASAESSAGAESQSVSGTDSGEPAESSAAPDESETGASQSESSAEPLPEPQFNPLLWKVSDGNGNYVYLFGTIHVGDERTLEVIKQIEPFIGECEAVAAEFDVVAYQQDTEAMMRDMELFFYTDGTTIYDHLPADLINEAIEFMINAGMGYSPAYEQMTAAIWWQLVDGVMLYTSESGLTSDYGVDMNILERCHKEGKKVLELESAQSQYEMLCSFEDRFYAELIRESIDSAPYYDESVTGMYEAWLSGDEEDILYYAFGDEAELEEYAEYEEWLEDAIEFYNFKMLTERNNNMFEKARGWLDGGKKVFVTAGEAHMLGDGGLVQMFEDAGYTVEKIGY